VIVGWNFFIFILHRHINRLPPTVQGESTLFAAIAGIQATLPKGSVKPLGLAVVPLIFSLHKVA